MLLVVVDGVVDGVVDRVVEGVVEGVVEVVVDDVVDGVVEGAFWVVLDVVEVTLLQHQFVSVYLGIEVG